MIKDLVIDKKAQVFAIVTLIREKVDVHNNPYVIATLEDKTGTIDTKLWKTKLTDFDEEIKAGDFVKLRGSVSEWEGKKQLEVMKENNKILLRKVSEADKVDINDYIKCAPIAPEEMFKYIDKLIEDFKDEELKALALKAIDVCKPELSYFPGAQQVHHSYKTGLLYHIFSMLQMSEILGNRYPSLNMDLLKTGVILHDLGKIRELKSNDFGQCEEYTLEGKLLGHAIIGIKMLHEFVASLLEINSEKVLLLEHMIASHHFDETWGAYQKPAFLEAELLHHLDMMDSRASQVETVLEHQEPGTFSQKQIYLDKRELYKPTV